MKPGWVTLLSVFLLAGTRALAADPSPDVPPGWDDARYFRLEDVRGGMHAVGRSAFQGARVDTFSAEILGVVKTGSPGGEMILARLSGQGLEKSGVVAGMSGSPIYIDGKLIGALAFGWPFSSEPITGITPISEMLRILQRDAGVLPGETPGPRMGYAPERWERLWEARGNEVWGPLLEGFPSSLAEPSPLAVPAGLGGFDAEVQAETEDIVARMGFLAVEGGASAGATETTGPLVAGSPVGICLLRGDAQIGITGTVTWTDGNRILAFGHPMFGLGPTQFPLCTADVVTVLPRLSSSFKMSAIGPMVGTLSRDYPTGVMGELGPSPELLPMEVDVTVGETKEKLRYELVDYDLITPILAGIASMNSVASLSRSAGSATVRMRVDITLDDGRVLSTESIQAGFSPPAALGGEVARLVGLLAGNPFEEVSLGRIQVTVSLENRIQAAFLDAISVGPGPYRPGDRVTVEMQLRDYRGGMDLQKTSFRVPETAAPGVYELTVCDGSQAARMEQERAPGVYNPRSLDQLLRLVESLPPYNHIVVRLYDDTASPVVAGREFPRLPGSLQSVFQNPGSGGRNVPAQKSVIAEKEETLSRIVLGCQTLPLSVEARP